MRGEDRVLQEAAPAYQCLHYFFTNLDREIFPLNYSPNDFLFLFFLENFVGLLWLGKDKGKKGFLFVESSYPINLIDRYMRFTFSYVYFYDENFIDQHLICYLLFIKKYINKKIDFDYSTSRFRYNSIDIFRCNI